MTQKTITVEARLAWALLWMGVIVFLGTLIWGFLNPHYYTIKDTSQKISPDSKTADEGWRRITLIWKSFPLWFGLGLLYWGYRRALNESQKMPGR